MRHYGKIYWRATVIVATMVFFTILGFLYRDIAWQPRPKPDDLQPFRIVFIPRHVSIYAEKPIVVAEGWKRWRYEHRTILSDGVVIAQKKRRPYVMTCAQQDLCHMMTNADGVRIQLSDKPSGALVVRAVNDSTEFHVQIPARLRESYHHVDWKQFFLAMKPMVFD